jgi:hypothetical protein
MGGGSWDTDRYTTDTKSRVASKTPDFAYTATAAARTTVHPTLNPKRINKKPFSKLESRDSDEHPESNAVLVCFDVTGSNYERAVDAQKKLPNLMALLQKYLKDPQVAVAANDDFNYVDTRSVQISDFESDNRIDESIRNVILVGQGGGNNGESYDLLLYAAARKMVLDCVEKRGKKGYMFMYADEPIFPFVSAGQVKDVFGDDLQGEIPIAEIIEEARQNFNIYMIWPTGGYDDARKQYVELFGEEYVLSSQHPNLICELIASTIGMVEDHVTSPTDIKRDLLAMCPDCTASDAASVSSALAVVAKSRGDIEKSSGKLESVGSGGATRL